MCGQLLDEVCSWPAMLAMAQGDYVALKRLAREPGAQPRERHGSSLTLLSQQCGCRQRFGDLPLEGVCRPSLDGHKRVFATVRFKRLRLRNASWTADDCDESLCRQRRCLGRQELETIFFCDGSRFIGSRSRRAAAVQHRGFGDHRVEDAARRTDDDLAADLGTRADEAMGRSSWHKHNQ